MNVKVENRNILLGLGFIILASGFAIGIPSQAAAGISAKPFTSVCQPFPNVGLWKNLTHASVRTQVESEYSGDWQAYIGKLEVYGNQLRRIRAKGKSALVTRGGQKIRLQGGSITQFLNHVDNRIAVTRCLAENSVEDQFETLDVASIAGFSTAAGGNEAPAAKCDALPNVDWWAFKTHEGIADYVDRKYQGDWKPYIDKWNTRLSKLRGILSRGSSAVTKTGVTLQGVSLGTYISQIQERISVTRCLAKRFGGQKI